MCCGGGPRACPRRRRAQSAALLGRRHVCGLGRQELVALGGIPARCHARCRFVPAVFVLGDARMRGCDARLAVLRAGAAGAAAAASSPRRAPPPARTGRRRPTPRAQGAP